MIDYVFNSPHFSGDQLIMKSPYHTRKLLFVSHNHQNAPSCGSCYSGLDMEYKEAFINGSVIIVNIKLYI
jgi:hypothetical protein